MLALLPPPTLAAGSSPSSMQTFFLIVMIVVVGYLYLRSQRYFARQKNDAASAAGAATTPPEKPYTAVPQDLTRWEVEMHDTARQLSGQLDGKLAALGHLIRDADRVAARLEAALAATRPAAPATTEEPSGNQARALQAAGAAEEPAESPAAASPSATPRPPADRRYEEIYLLADYGFDPAEIGRRVNMPVGEIQLILSLRAKR